METEEAKRGKRGRGEEDGRKKTGGGRATGGWTDERDRRSYEEEGVAIEPRLRSAARRRWRYGSREVRDGMRGDEVEREIDLIEEVSKGGAGGQGRKKSPLTEKQRAGDFW